MEQSMAEVEALLGYRFSCRALLEQALTHSSFTDSVSYERLEFMGDSALNLALTSYLFLAFPNLDPGSMTALRSANVNTEKFARAAVRHRLYRHLRHHATALDSKVKEFADSIRENEAIEAVKAPKVLANVVESIAGAVYVDSDFNLQLLWTIFRGLLEPIVTPDTLKSNPLSELYKICQKAGKRPDFKHRMKGTKHICGVYTGEHLVGMGCSEHKDIAKLSAAKNALEKLARNPSETGVEKRTRLQLIGMGCSKQNDIAKLSAAKNALEKLARNTSETGVKKRTRLQLAGMGCSEQKDIAKLSAAKNALEKLARSPLETGVKKRPRLQLVGMGCSEQKDIVKLSAAKNVLEKLARNPSETGVKKRTRLQLVGMGCSEQKDSAKLSAAKNALEKLARNPSETGVTKHPRLQLVGMGCSEQKDIAKLSTAKNALVKLARNPSKTGLKERTHLVECSQVVEKKKEPANSKHMLSVFCSNKHLPPPSYRVEKVTGPNHGTRFTCSVQVQTLVRPIIEYGVPKARVKDTENSRGANRAGICPTHYPARLVDGATRYLTRPGWYPGTVNMIPAGVQLNNTRVQIGFTRTGRVPGYPGGCKRVCNLLLIPPPTPR